MQPAEGTSPNLSSQRENERHVLLDANLEEHSVPILLIWNELVHEFD